MNHRFDLPDLIALDIETAAAPGATGPGAGLVPHMSRITVVGVYGENFSQCYRGDDIATLLNTIVLNDAKLIGHNFKFDLKHLLHHFDIDLSSQWIGDTQLAAYLLPGGIPKTWLEKYETLRGEINETIQGTHRRARGLSLKTLAPYHLGVDAFWEDPKNHDDDAYVLKDCEYTFKLWSLFTTKHFKENPNIKKFYEECQLPWTKNLFLMEQNGFSLNLDEFYDLKTSIAADREQTEQVIKEQWASYFDEWRRLQKESIAEQYREMADAAVSKLKDKTKEQGTRMRYAALYQAAVDKKDTELNLNSPEQLKWLLRDKLGYDLMVEVRDKETNTVEVKESTGKEVLQGLVSNGARDVEKLLEYRKLNKLHTSYFPRYEELMQHGSSTRLYPSFNPTGARTGRLSCIEQDQLVSVPGAEKPIKDIRPGEYVYSWNVSEKKLEITKVLNVIDNGYQECVELKWQSSGSGDIGTLICTPDHKLLEKHGTWKEAQDLTRHQKLVHMRRSVQKSGRVRVYGSEKIMELEESLIKREYFECPSILDIHHIDEDKSNNSLDNLAVCTRKGHMNIHAYSAGRFVTTEALPTSSLTKKSKFWALRRLAETRGVLTKIPHDFSSFKRLCKARGIPIRLLKKRYSSSGVYLNKAAVLKAIENRRVDEAAAALGIGTRKLKQLCTEYGLCYNHAVQKLTPIGKRRVYDLEVEKNHNFFASEICVHNCSLPNLQQVPPQIRPLFSADIVRDYSALEPVLIAHYSQDENLKQIITQGQSFHSVNAIQIFNLDCAESDVKTKYPNHRKAAKEFGLSVLYGAGAGRVQKSLLKYGFDCTIEECKEFVKRLREHYSGVWEFKQDLDQALESGDTFYNILGRPIHFDDPEDVYMKGFNTLIQGSGSDLLQEAALQIHKKIPGVKVIGLVHDELIAIKDLTAPPNAAKIVDEIMTGFKLEGVSLSVEGSDGPRWDK